MSIDLDELAVIANTGNAPYFREVFDRDMALSLIERVRKAEKPLSLDAAMDFFVAFWDARLGGDWTLVGQDECGNCFQCGVRSALSWTYALLSNPSLADLSPTLPPNYSDLVRPNLRAEAQAAQANEFELIAHSEAERRKAAEARLAHLEAGIKALAEECASAQGLSVDPKFVAGRIRALLNGTDKDGA